MNMKTEYKYINPIDKGYKKFKLSKKIHNKLFKYSQIKWYDRYEYYYNDKRIIIHKFYNIYRIIIETIFFPITILFNGFLNIKSCWESLKNLHNQKKNGNFISDSIPSSSNTYKNIMIIING